MFYLIVLSKILLQLEYLLQDNIKALSLVLLAVGLTYNAVLGTTLV